MKIIRVSNTKSIFKHPYVIFIKNLIIVTLIGWLIYSLIQTPHRGPTINPLNNAKIVMLEKQDSVNRIKIDSLKIAVLHHARVVDSLDALLYKTMIKYENKVKTINSASAREHAQWLDSTVAKAAVSNNAR